MTRVVNMRRGELYDVYIGRPGRGMAGTFGNPYPAGKTCNRCGQLHVDGDSTLSCFEAYFLDRVNRDRAFRLQALHLRGKVLGCFCKPSRCHGDVIAAWVDRQCEREEILQ